MKNFSAATIFIFCYLFYFNVSGQTSAVTDSSQVKIVKANLNDGTRIWGVIEKEDQNIIVIRDFNIGSFSIEKNKIKNIEINSSAEKITVETANGTSYFGHLLGMKEQQILLRTELLDTIYIQANTITKISFSNVYVSRKGDIWFTNPNATRYFFAPSAIPLNKGEGYFQNAYLLANSVNVGVTNNFTVGGGVVIPLLFYVTPKLTYKVAKNFYTGGGILFTQSFIEDFGLSAGIGYGLITYGTPEHNATIGAGYGIAKFNNEYRETPGPIVTVNGMTRVTKKVSLVTENWFIPRAGYDTEILSVTPDGVPYTEMVYQSNNFYSSAFSFGLRFMPGVKTSIDFSVVAINVDPDANMLVLPYLDFVYKFN